MNRTILRPRPLMPGETVGICTPSTPANVLYRKKYLHGISQVESLGFNTLEGSLTASRRTQGYRAGTPQERAGEFMELILNPEVRCIITTIGGNNSSSMIPYLDFDAIRANPKIVCGYSDITSLHLALLAYSGLSTFYGPAVMPSFGEWPTMLPETKDSFLDAVQRHRSGSRTLNPPTRWSNHFRDAKTDAWKTEPRHYEPNPGWRVLNSGAASGPIVAANLNTLLTSAGTSYFPNLDGVVLMIEDAVAPIMIEERGLRQLDLMGVFDRITGLIVGKPEVYRSEGAPFSYDDLILEVVGPREYPIVSEFDCSHTCPMLTIAQMTPITLTAREGYDVEFVVERPMVAEAETGDGAA